MQRKTKERHPRNNKQTEHSLPSAMEVTKNFFLYNCVMPLKRKPLLPRYMVYYINYKCNARCVMCGIWQEQANASNQEELSQDELITVLKNPLFAKVTYLNINGGEPTLRKDLSETVINMLKTRRSINRVSLISNGLLPQKLTSSVKQIMKFAQTRNIHVSVRLSIHGIGSVHDDIMGVSYGWEKTNKSVASLKELQKKFPFYLGAICVLQAANIQYVGEIERWFRENELPVRYVVEEQRESLKNFNNATPPFDAEGKKTLLDFFDKLSQQRSLHNPEAFRYHRLKEMISCGADRKQSCYYAMAGVVVGANGELYYCPHSKELGNGRQKDPYTIYFDKDNIAYRKSNLEKGQCPTCPIYTYNRYEIEKDILHYLNFLSRK